MLTKTCHKCFEPVPKELFGEHLASACIALGGTSGALKLRKTSPIAKPTASNVAHSSAVHKSARLEYKSQKRVIYKPIYCRRCDDFTTYFQHEFEQHVRLCLTKNFVFCPCCDVPIEESTIAEHIKGRITKFYTFLLRNSFEISRKGYHRCCSCLCLVQSVKAHQHSCPFYLESPYTTNSSRSIKCPECLQPVTWKYFFTHVGIHHPQSLVGIKCPRCSRKPQNLDKHLLKCPSLKKKKAVKGRKKGGSVATPSPEKSKYNGLPSPSYGKALDGVYLDGSRGYDQFRDSSGRFHSYSSFDDYGENGMP